jgi:hypothetical protein
MLRGLCPRVSLIFADLIFPGANAAHDDLVSDCAARAALAQDRFKGEHDAGRPAHGMGASPHWPQPRQGHVMSRLGQAYCICPRRAIKIET